MDNEINEVINWLLSNQNEDIGWADMSSGRKSDLNCIACALAILPMGVMKREKGVDSLLWGYIHLLTELVIYPTYAKEGNVQGFT